MPKGQNYVIPKNPVYNPDIPSLADTESASATDTFNPWIQPVVENIAAVHKLASNPTLTTTSSGQNYFITPSPAVTEYQNGMRFFVQFNTANTGFTPNLNAIDTNSANNRRIYLFGAGTTNPEAGTIQNNSIWLVEYVGTHADGRFALIGAPFARVSDVVAAAGTETTLRSWSPQMVAHAVRNVPTTASASDPLNIPANPSAISRDVGVRVNLERLQGQVNKVSGTGKKTATLVVGTTQSGHTAADVDFLCTGTNDHTQINAAINALPSNGGKVVIREGTYNIGEDEITINKNNIILEGMGNSTIIMGSQNMQRMGVVSAEGSFNIIRNLKVDTSSYSAGVYLNGEHNIIEACDIRYVASGIELQKSFNTVINNRIIRKSTGDLHSIQVTATPGDTVEGNMIIGNYLSKNLTYWEVEQEVDFGPPAGVQIVYGTILDTIVANNRIIQ